MTEQSTNKPETLVVDDSATILATAKKMLGDEFVVHTASNGIEAWELIKQIDKIKIVFSDMQMPEMNGMQLLLKVRESDDARIAKLPMVMITGASDSPAGKRAVFDIGATDFIGKPFDAMDLISRARTNTTPQRRSSDQMSGSSKEAFITPSGFQNIGNEALARAFETKEEFSVVQIELTNIDDIKETIGSKAVRQIIVSIIKRISDVLRDKDVATRIGENRFALLMYSDHNSTKQAVQRLCEYMKKLVFEINGRPLPIDLTYGFSSANCYDRDSKFSDICKQADVALYEAFKITLGNKVAAFDDSRSSVVESSESEVLDIWPSLTHIVDGNYHLVNVDHTAALVKCLNSYLEYVKKNKL